MSDDSIMKWPLERIRPAVSRGNSVSSFFVLGYVEKARCGLTKPQQKKKEEGERLRGDRDKIKLIDLGLERSPE